MASDARYAERAGKAPRRVAMAAPASGGAAAGSVRGRGDRAPGADGSPTATLRLAPRAWGRPQSHGHPKTTTERIRAATGPFEKSRTCFIFFIFFLFK